MSEHIETKNDEQYPLLKMDSGDGESKLHPKQTTPTVVTPGCNVTCASKQSWVDRWPLHRPEFVSACWIAFILIGISFLAFYAMGKNAYRRQPLLITKCNVSYPANLLYYHHIVPRGSYMPFMIYSDYISNIAMQYPSLYIKVVFLMDDSTQNSMHGSRHTRLFDKLIQPSNNLLNSVFYQSNKRDIQNIQKKYPNVNVTIMSLSKYMTMTPLRYKWTLIPLHYLTFYVRIFAVWQNGGIAMDLTSYNNMFNMHKYQDRRITAILKQHNDGIDHEKYVNVLKKMYQEDENEFLTMFYLLMQNVLNETYSFLNRPLWYADDYTNRNITLVKNLPRVLRNKPYNLERYETNESDLSQGVVALKNALNSSMVLNKTNTEAIDADTNFTFIANYSYTNLLLTNNFSYNNSPKANLSNNNNKLTMHETSVIDKSFTVTNVTKQPIAEANKDINSSCLQVDIPQFVLLYDVSILHDMGPIPNLPNLNTQTDSGIEKKSEKTNVVERSQGNLPVLSISSDGTFVAVSTQQHPLLENLILSEYQTFNPAVAIKRALVSQCSGLFNIDLYCNNIFIL